jgi:hypothetical protein
VGSAGLRLGHVAIDGGALAVTGVEVDDMSAFADARLLELPLGLRFELGGTVSRGILVDAASVRGAVGVTRMRGRLDVSAWVRAGALSYTASVDPWSELRAGLDILVTPRHDLDVALSLEGATGPDLDAIALLTTVIWRAMP